MTRRGKTWFALLSAVTAFGIPAFVQAKQVQFVQVPVVTEEHLRFFRLPWPSTRVVARKVIQDNQGFLWLGRQTVCAATTVIASCAFRKTKTGTALVSSILNL